MNGKRIGDMTPGERDAAVAEAVGKFQRELDVTADAISEVLNTPLEDL